MFKIMFVPPVYVKAGIKTQAKPYVLAWANTREDAVSYAIAATDRFAKRPGLVKVIQVSEAA